MSDHEEVRGWNLDNSYARLPSALYEPAVPARFPSPRLVACNRTLLDEIGLETSCIEDATLAALCTGQRLPSGAQPIAQAYAGHQYGQFTMLGDGRALLIGEQVTPSGVRVDIHLKGAGQTRYSRRGDGRAALGPMLREHLIGEAMHAFGIPTTRSLAVATTGETILRDGPKPGAVLTRVAASHIRVGTFQYAAAIGQPEVLRALADHAIQRHDPRQAGLPNGYAGFLRGVIARQAALVARWQCVGFVHGVLNSDNTSIAGETLDYGPCAFLDGYHADTVFSSIDHHGRYRFGHQPAIVQWNLARLAEALVPLLSDDETTAVAVANEALDGFAHDYRTAWMKGMRAKLGLAREHPEDAALVADLMTWMQERHADFTGTFRTLSCGGRPDGLSDWFGRWLGRLDVDGRPREEALRSMRRVNPAVIPRNHRVEEALAAAEERGDLAPFNQLLAVVLSPYELAPSMARYAEPPPVGCAPHRTYCGT